MVFLRLRQFENSVSACYYLTVYSVMTILSRKQLGMKLFSPKIFQMIILPGMHILIMVNFMYFKNLPKTEACVDIHTLLGNLL